MRAVIEDCKALYNRARGLLNNYSELIDGMKEICNEDGLQAAVEEQQEVTRLLQDSDRYYTVVVAENEGIAAVAASDAVAEDAENVDIDELVGLTDSLSMDRP